MCVTNIAKRTRPVVAANPAKVASTPSVISQRLMGNFMPMLLNTTTLKPNSTVSTCSNVAGIPRAPLETNLPNDLNYFPPQHLTPALDDEKSRPKRRRKPQKPGKTAKHNDRHFVVHNYHDHAFDPDEHDEEKDDTGFRRRGGIAVSFPMKLHSVLDQVEADGLGHIISWQGHGRCFVIHKPKEFVDTVMPNYFRQSKLTSFQRQLNLYGFCRLTRGQDSGGYYHELFLRGKAFLTKKMQRTKIKGTKFKAASSPEQEPDFYTMPQVIVTPHNTSDESSSDEKKGTRLTIARRKLPLDQCLFTDDLTSDLSFEHIPSQANPVVSTMETFPIMTEVSSVSNWIAYSTKRSAADQILDEAAEELFRNDPVMGEADLQDIWDSTAFGEERVQDDMQLGYLLEQLLEE